MVGLRTPACSPALCATLRPAVGVAPRSAILAPFRAALLGPALLTALHFPLALAFRTPLGPCPVLTLPYAALLRGLGTTTVLLSLGTAPLLLGACAAALLLGLRPATLLFTIAALLFNQPPLPLLIPTLLLNALITRIGGMGNRPPRPLVRLARVRIGMLNVAAAVKATDRLTMTPIGINLRHLEAAIDSRPARCLSLRKPVLSRRIGHKHVTRRSSGRSRRPCDH